MLLNELPSNQIFVFNDDDYRFVYLKVDTGYVDIFYDRFWKQEELKKDLEISKIDRSFIWKEAYKLEMNKPTIERMIQDALEKHSNEQKKI